ncbi:MAG: rhodanese-related sulfurtransferase [Halonotius sp. J07HN6]|jgi:Rhodanese-related sulfurtransferase|nr:MAG: rhodanese-related sulfurtransferase [Halonotius sp. J07HN6]
MTDTAVPTLVAPKWLEDRLDAPDVKILDCTVYLDTDENGESRIESGYDGWADAHIPGSAFADLVHNLSETADPDYPFQLPTPEDFAAAVGSLGVSNESRVVVYDSVDAKNNNEWAARLWWMFRVFGHDQVGVLDGGWSRWTAEDRPVSETVTEPEAATFTADYRSELVADKDDITSQLDSGEACVINALQPSDHAAQRIPGSENVPAVGEEAVITDDGTYQSEETLQKRFADVGATDADNVITYCGAGIAASSEALALYQAGVTDAAVYDGSLSEWTADPNRPVATDR